MEKTSYRYAGLKVVEAQPMTVKQAEKILGRKIDMAKHENEKDGYLIAYPDGYQSFSPKSVFEDAYSYVGDESIVVMFTASRRDITPEMLRTEFKNWQIEMAKKYNVTFPGLKILE